METSIAKALVFSEQPPLGNQHESCYDFFIIWYMYLPTMSLIAAPLSLLPEDPCPYGWRQVCRHRPDGSRHYERHPLGPRDFLDPQPGDVMIQGTLHWQCAKELHNRFEVRYLDDLHMGVFADLKMRWGIPELEEPAPDLAIVPGVRDKAASRSTFDVVAEGTRPCLIIEVVSPTYVGDETDKVRIYERAAIQEYLIVKPYGVHGTRDFSLTGYRLVEGRYRPWSQDTQGYLRSTTVQVWIRVCADGRDLELIDAFTGEPLRNMAQTERARRHEAERARRAETELERLQARLRALGIDPDA